MKTLRTSILYVLIALLLLSSQACLPQTPIVVTATPEPSPTLSESLPPTELVEPTVIPTEAPAVPTEAVPTAVPMPVIIPNGQIAYIFGGNVWRYLTETGTSVQVTTDAIPGDYENSYRNARFSPDGRYLAYNKAGVSYIADLVAATVMDLSVYGQFISWTGEGLEFFATLGDMECPAVENLADQALLNFDIYRYDLANLSAPVFLANISGGLKFVSKISRDGQWAAINSCGCYSECGSEQLWHLPTASMITPPAGFNPGNFDFSPDSSSLTLSTWQMYGYIESPLYVANIDMSALTPVFTEPQTAPTLALWSPDGQQLAFTAITFDTASMEEMGSRVFLAHPAAGTLTTVEGGYAKLVDWAPDGTKLLFKQNYPGSDFYYTYDLVSGVKTPLPFSTDAYSSGSIDWGNFQ